MLAWVDIETTGLNPKKDIPLEIALVITDDDLNPVFKYHTPIQIVGWRKHVNWVKYLHPYVREMHTKNGLIMDIKAGLGVDIKDVDSTMAFLIQLGCEGRQPYLAGSTISFDRSFLKRFFPLTTNEIHYRNIDVSTFRCLTEMWKIGEVPAKGEAHRAMDDILESIENLEYYKSLWLRDVTYGAKE